MNADSVFVDRSLVGIDHDGTKGNLRRGRAGCLGPSLNSSDPGDELFHVEGLSDVVVSAFVEATDFGGYSLTGCDEYYRQARAIGAKRAADREPLNIGEHPVKQDNIVAAFEGCRHSRASVIAYIHGHVLEEKLDFDDPSEGSFVFDKEYSHRFHPHAAKSVFAMPA